VSVALACPKCQGLLEAGDEARRQACPHCGLDLLAWAGAAALVPAVRAGARALEGEATCYFHASRRAERACDSCGRFVCALCDLPLGRAHVCPSCLEEGRSPQVQSLVAAAQWRWDRIVFNVSILSLFLFFLSFITAPVILGLCIRHWRLPASLPVGRGGARARLVTALLLSLTGCGVWLWIAGSFLVSLLA
jgi:hypothetical protein